VECSDETIGNAFVDLASADRELVAYVLNVESSGLELGNCRVRLRPTNRLPELDSVLNSLPKLLIYGLELCLHAPHRLNITPVLIVFPLLEEGVALLLKKTDLLVDLANSLFDLLLLRERPLTLIKKLRLL